MDALVLFFFFHGTEARPWLTVVAEFLSSSMIYIAPIALGLFVLAAEKNKIQKISYALISILGSVALTTYILKPLFVKARPFITLGYEPLVAVTGFSLPSTHAALAGALFVAAYCTVSMHRRVVLSVAWVVAILIALSRLMLGVHYPSDVVVGFLVGCAFAWICNWIMIKVS